MTPSQSEESFIAPLQTQSQLFALIVDEANIRAEFISIQTNLIPHVEIQHNEIGYAKTLLDKDPHISTLDGLVHLATDLAIQIKSLDVVCENQDVSLKIILDVHKYFVGKHTISVQPIDLSVKKGEVKCFRGEKKIKERQNKVGE